MIRFEPYVTALVFVLGVASSFALGVEYVDGDEVCQANMIALWTAAQAENRTEEVEVLVAGYDFGDRDGDGCIKAVREVGESIGWVIDIPACALKDDGVNTAYCSWWIGRIESRYGSTEAA